MSNLYADNNGAYGELLLGRGYNHLGEHVNDTHSTDWVLSGKLGVGYKIDKYIGLEAGYEQFGQRRFNNIGGTAASAVANENAVEIQTVVRFALSDNLSLLGKIGPAYVQATTSVNNGDAQTTNQYQANHSAWCADYALGASYVLDDFPGLELTAIYSHIVTNNNIPDADLYAAGLIFNF
jgi:opacity protein-like surface antigen